MAVAARRGGGLWRVEVEELQEAGGWMRAVGSGTE